MSQNCSDIQLEASLEELEIDLAKIHAWVNGTASETVNLGGVATATIRKLVQDFYTHLDPLAPATTSRLGGIIVGDGLSVLSSGRLSVDFSQMPTDKFEALLKQLRLPLWLTRHTDFYVRPDGSNSNNGQTNTAAGAFRTIQGALNYVSENYNMSTYAARIRIAAGTYTENITLPKYNAVTGNISLIGADKDAVQVVGSMTGIQSAGTFYFSNMTLKTIEGEVSPSSSNFNIISIQSGIIIHLTNVAFDASVAPATGSGTYPIVVGSGGSVNINEDCSIYAPAIARAINLIYLNGGLVNIRRDLTLAGAVTGPTFRVQSLGTLSIVTLAGMSKPVLYGEVTGKRYSVESNSILNTAGGGAYYIPGTTDGTTSSGGQYT